MDVSKPLATLSSALLARKGGAKPSSRPELGTLDSEISGQVVPITRADGMVDARTQQQHIREVFADHSARARQSAFERGGKAAFTLRLDEDRHLRLRLACTATNRSAQQVVTEALDAFLDQMPDIDALAGDIRRRRSN